MTEKEKQLTQEMIELAEFVKSETSWINTREHVPQLQLEMVVDKIKMLYEKSVILKYLHSNADLEKFETEEEKENIEQQTPNIVSRTKEEKPATDKLNEQVEKEIKSLNVENVSVNEKMAEKQGEKSLADTLNKPVSNLNVAIGINEKFLYQNELFGGNTEAYVDSLEKLNTLQNIEDAKNYVSENFTERYQWDMQSEAVKSFMHLLERRYN